MTTSIANSRVNVAASSALCAALVLAGNAGPANSRVGQFYTKMQVYDAKRPNSPTYAEIFDFDASTTNLANRFYLSTSEDNSQRLTNATTVASTRDALLSNIAEIKSLGHGWDGGDSVAPNLNAVEDAFAVAQSWPSNFKLPYVDADYEGRVAFDVFNDDGFAVGGIVFSGSNHSAIFTVVDGSSVIFTGSFDTSSQTEIIQSFSALSEFFA